MNIESVITITIMTLIAGVGGTGLGGAIGSLVRTESNRLVSLLLAATSGVMISIVCFELVVECFEASEQVFANGAVFLVCAAILVGMAVVALLNWIIDRRTIDEVPHTANSLHPKTHDNIDELSHVDHYNQHLKEHAPKRELWVAGVVIACAIALHNIPEGMSIGASYNIDTAGEVSMALVLAVLIGIHNIPEGMAVSVPLVAGGMGRVKAALLTAASGFPIVLGAWVGFWLGDIGAMGLACSLGFASGAMLYVVFGEIIPQAVLMYRSKLPAFFVILGMLIGLCIIYF
ncbi:ZIP family metal transporter [Anaerotardibacter muris]|uniref:ZIP family metal transporter n=1 Tax=Anaerotardibacter muris TaxID=2941505 RepID=UPI002040083C|nr:ZIP family metal transporter [Anaerotardibacter muris]